MIRNFILAAALVAVAAPAFAADMSATTTTKSEMAPMAADASGTMAKKTVKHHVVKKAPAKKAETTTMTSETTK